ncbi:hypothetical protein EGI26_05805 [Lacihabitans sp. CCS-44]|uniref:hypothetical protein n=1 Tax=Lacihabitans sp. CCS-44 TaxID=2487331 RepID=UPI0020CEAC93|nr:hypothetical protein [Lacihabitans sp. CCS-44]MCP9754677.1 hypothetical protein [Lacihabitans sp. CCS-44]
MNAFREYYEGTDDTLVIKIPKEYQKKRLEVIILPAEDTDYKLQLLAIMDKISTDAQKSGLTEEKLQELLDEKDSI